MSDRDVGLTSRPPSVVVIWPVPISSGASQRVEPPLVEVEPLAEQMLSAIEERPKSARQGLPWASIRMLCYTISRTVRTKCKGGKTECTNTLQVPMNHLVGV